MSFLALPVAGWRFVHDGMHLTKSASGQHQHSVMCEFALAAPALSPSMFPDGTSP
jgi:hypothetical protein